MPDEMASTPNGDGDVEKYAGVKERSTNVGIDSFTWKDVEVFRKSLTRDVKPTPIISGVQGLALAGKLMKL